MAITGRLVIYPDAAEKVINTSECRSYLYRVAQAALNDAYAAAPVLSGHYRDSLFASIIEGDSPKAQLASSSSFWHWVEFGSINNDPHRVLSAAVQGQVDIYVPVGG
jgi:hypothetical protein